MELIDVIIGVLLLLEIFKGYKRGFMAEAGSIIGLILGLIVALAFRTPMAHLFSAMYAKEGLWPSVVGFLATFLLVYFVITILAKLFEGFLGFVALGWVNRWAGGLFCFIKGILFLSILMNLNELVDKDHIFIGVKHIESSVLYEPVFDFAPKLFPSFKLINESRQEQKTDTNDSNKIIV